MKICFSFLLMFYSLIAFSQDPWKNVYKESAWAERDEWQKPTELIRQLRINEPSVVADIGCHEGYMTVKLSKVVGMKGKVFAVDVDQSKLDKLQEHLTERKITNVITVKGDYDNPKLPSNSLDAIVILDTYHEMDDHDKILQRILIALKPGGRMAICEPLAEARKGKPRKDQEERHELEMKYALDDLTKAGFQIISKDENFVNRTKVKGDRMWLVIARKRP